MSPTATAEKTAAFVEIWKKAFTKVLSQLSGGETRIVEPPKEVAATLEPRGEAAGNVLRTKFSGGGVLKGELLWSCEKSVALRCAQLLMSEEINPAAEFSEMHTDGFLEFIRQVAGEAAVGWKQEIGEPVDITYQAGTVSNFETRTGVTLQADTSKAKNLIFHLDLDPEMLGAVQTEPAPAEAPSTGVSGKEGVNNASAGAFPSNLDLILDVQLDATIRFGEREMILQDVFGLMPGAVVELNQLVSEPADLLVAGRLVAKGEVVVVDGNFGLRVTEVVSRSQRAAMLEIG